MKMTVAVWCQYLSFGAGEMTPTLLAAPAGDPVQFSAPTWWLTANCYANSRESNVLFRPPWTPDTHAVPVHACRQNSHVSNRNKNTSLGTLSSCLLIKAVSHVSQAILKLVCVAEADHLAATVMLLSTSWGNRPVPPHLMPVTVSAHRLLSFACLFCYIKHFALLHFYCLSSLQTFSLSLVCLTKRDYCPYCAQAQSQ